jgi:NADH:ubiquinone oxidoreductase subunit 3 (subunit A)
MSSGYEAHLATYVPVGVLAVGLAYARRTGVLTWT